MIIWIASYPKSGNTWLKLFLSAYIGNHVDPKTFDINKMMIPFSLFPTTSLIKKFDIFVIKFTESATLDTSSDFTHKLLIKVDIM